MVILKRSASMIVSVHALSSLKKLYFPGLRKRLYLSRLMLINLKRLTKILTRKRSMQQVYFNFSRSRDSIKTFS